MNNSIGRKKILIGAGGHSKVLNDILTLNDEFIDYVCDRKISTVYTNFEKIEEEEIKKFDKNSVSIINGIGMLPGQNKRIEIYKKFTSIGFTFETLIHKNSIISESAIISDGVQVLAGAIIGPNSFVGSNSIVNTKASIDHDCNIGSSVHIAPGAIICGDVEIGDNTFVGAGSIIVNGSKINSNSIIKAGELVYNNKNTSKDS